VKDVADYGLKHRDMSNLLCIGIAEISQKKGHVYDTQVYDLVEKKLLWSGNDRKAERLEGFFDEPGEERCEQIEAVCSDMCAPYIDVVRARLPNGFLVFGKFHIIRLLIENGDGIRKKEARQLKAEAPDLLKKTRYIWLKYPWNLAEH
jgi:transposase